jgi:hypothetical protein
LSLLHSDFQNTILKARSKLSITQIALLALEDETKLDLLLQNIRSENERLFYISSWALSDISEIYNEILFDKVLYIVETINNSSHQGLKRNLMKVIQLVAIPEDLEFKIGEMCLCFLKKRDETIAVKAYSVTVLENLLSKNIVFNEEVLFELEKQMIYSTPAFHARAKKYLKKAKKLGIGNFTNVFNDF